MSKVTKAPGLRPTIHRDAEDVLDQINNIRNVLGASAWASMGGAGDYAAQDGAIGPENFADTAGIVETKVEFGSTLSSEHDHSRIVANSGAALADESIGDLQLDWDGTPPAPPNFTRGLTNGMILRFGYWDDSKVPGGSGATTVFSATGGYDNEGDAQTEPEPNNFRIYFSTGHDFQRGTTPPSTTEKSGSPFPVGSSPVVVMTPRAEFDSGVYGAGVTLPYKYPLSLRDDLNSNDPNGLLDDALWRVNFSISLVTHEYFDIRVHIPSNDNVIGEWLTYCWGIYWMAVYDPGSEAYF